MRAKISMGLLFAALGLSTGTAHAFNTGAHFVATDMAMSSSGFSGTAIKYAKIANFQVDWMSNKCDHVGGLLCSARDEKISAAAEHFHFDELPSPERIALEEAWLARAAEALARKARASNDPEMLLNVMGITFHALQDLYSHANWVDTPWQNWLGTNASMWVTDLDALNEDIWSSPAIGHEHVGARLGLMTGRVSSAELRTEVPLIPVDFPGPLHDTFQSCVGEPRCSEWHEHGKGESTADASEVGGPLNHDTVLRPRHLSSILSAANATQRWLGRFKEWAGPVYDDARRFGDVDTVLYAQLQRYATTPQPTAVNDVQSYSLQRKLAYEAVLASGLVAGLPAFATATDAQVESAIQSALKALGRLLPTPGLGDCYSRAKQASVLAGQWGYPTGQDGARVFRLLGSYGCSDYWEDHVWGDVLLAAYDDAGLGITYPDATCGTGALLVTRWSSATSGAATLPLASTDSMAHEFQTWARDTWEGSFSCHAGAAGDPASVAGSYIGTISGAAAGLQLRVDASVPGYSLGGGFQLPSGEWAGAFGMVDGDRVTLQMAGSATHKAVGRIVRTSVAGVDRRYLVGFLHLPDGRPEGFVLEDVTRGWGGAVP